MSIALDAPAARTPSATRLALSRRKITGRCDRSNILSVAAFCGNGRKDLITMRPLRRAMKRGAGNHGVPCRNWNRDSLATRRVAAAPRSGAMAVVISETLHPITVRGDVRIVGIADVGGQGPRKQTTPNAQRSTFKAQGRHQRSRIRCWNPPQLFSPW